MKVWIFQTGEPLPSDAGHPRPMRAMNLVDALLARGHEVVLWSSCFNHQEKIHRYREFTSLSHGPRLTIKLIPSRGYTKHISVARLIDHAQMARALSAKLASLVDDKPDVAFVGFPPIETAMVLIDWLRDNGVPAVLDVKDLWPSIFEEAMPKAVRPFAPLLLSPYYYMAKRAIARASAISSISGQFLREVLAIAGRAPNGIDQVFPLVPGPKSTVAHDPSAALSWWHERGVDLSHSRRFAFVGALSRAYDFGPLREAANRLQTAGVDAELVICGGGQELERVQDQFQGLGNVKFPGWVDLPKIEVLLRASSATLAPYRSTHDFKMSIPNKIIDSLSFALPVITSLDGETRFVLERERAGIYCGSVSDAWEEALLKILHDSEFKTELSLNAKRLFDKEFSYEVVYGNFVNVLENLEFSSRPLKGL